MMIRKLWTDKSRYRKLSKKIPLGTPLSLLIEPTNRCNFSCIYCPTGNKDLLKKTNRPSGDMNLKLFKKIVNDIGLFPDKIDRISLYKDGEPLLHPDLSKMIRFLKDAHACNEVSITSNAALLTEKLAVEIVESGLDSIRFSIVSVSGCGYKKLARTACSYNNIRGNIALLNKVKQDMRRASPAIYTKIIDFNLSSAEKQRFRDECSVISDEISIDEPMNWDGYHSLDFTLGRKEAVKERRVCPRPWYTMAINFNGQVSVCCVDWCYKTIIGDVKKESLVDIWHGKRLYEFRRMHAEMKRHENPACKDCEYINNSAEESNLDPIAIADRDILLKKVNYDDKID